MYVFFPVIYIFQLHVISRIYLPQAWSRPSWPQSNWVSPAEPDSSSGQNTNWSSIESIPPHIEYCSHLWAGAPQYQLEPFDRIQRRAVAIIGDTVIYERLNTLALRRDVASLCVLYRIYHGECPRELFELVPQLSTQCLQNQAKYRVRSVLTLGFHCLPCCGTQRETDSIYLFQNI